MRKPAIVALLLVLLAAAVVQAQTVKNHMMVGPYAGYTLGVDNGADGVNFGGNFHYGLTDRMMIGGDLFVQNYDYEFGSSTETNILGSLLYTMSAMQKAVFMLNAGAGLYGNGSGTELGLYGGIIYNYLIARTIMIAFMPRLHFILADETAMVLQLSVGVNWWLGATGTPID